MKLKRYVKPASLQEAITILRETDGPVTLLAGGTDVLVYGREANDRYADHTIVDIFGLPELSGISEDGDYLVIGAGATHSEIEQSPLVQRYADVLACACRTVGSLQIRNHATIGGNIGNASPAADTFAALAVLDAQVEIDCLGQLRRERIQDIIARPYHTTLTDRDILLRILIRKLPDGTRCNFYKLGRRHALAISRMTIATVLRCDASGVVQDFRMTMGATFPQPMMFPEINEMLIGKRPDEGDIAAVSKALSDKIPEIAGIRASTTYKQPVCQRMCARILHEMLER
jgi:CO/xanthine dehydrogenase FAD-binding subunit